MTSPQFLLENSKNVVATCRATSPATIVLGGAGYSIFPESALAYLGADMGIQGEGEVAFPALLSWIERRQRRAGTARGVSSNQAADSKSMWC